MVLRLCDRHRTTVVRPGGRRRRWWRCYSPIRRNPEPLDTTCLIAALSARQGSRVEATASLAVLLRRPSGTGAAAMHVSFVSEGESVGGVVWIDERAGVGMLKPANGATWSTTPDAWNTTGMHGAAWSLRHCINASPASMVAATRRRFISALHQCAACIDAALRRCVHAMYHCAAFGSITCGLHGLNIFKMFISGKKTESPRRLLAPRLGSDDANTPVFVRAAPIELPLIRTAPRLEMLYVRCILLSSGKHSGRYQPETCWPLISPGPTL